MAGDVLTTLTFFMLQRDRLLRPTPVEAAVTLAAFQRAGSTDDTSESRAHEEWSVARPPHPMKWQTVKHPLNYLWPICMGRHM